MGEMFGNGNFSVLQVFIMCSTIFTMPNRVSMHHLYSCVHIIFVNDCITPCINIMFGICY
jgi:hypothetical protein